MFASRGEEKGSKSKTRPEDRVSPEGKERELTDMETGSIMWGLVTTRAAGESLADGTTNNREEEFGLCIFL